MILDAETRALFQEEVQENLAELDGALLELEKAPGEVGLIDRIFRAVHTLKGACDMFGLGRIVALAHNLESLFDQIRSGARQVDKALLDVAFQVKDRLAAMLADGADAAMEDPALSRRLQEVLRTGEAGDAPAVSDAPAAAPASPAETSAQAGPDGWHVRFAPSDPGHLAKTDPLALLDDVRALGQVALRCDLSGVPELADLDPDDCHLRFEADVVMAPGSGGDNALRDIFLFLENPDDVVLEPRTDPAGTPRPDARAEPVTAPAALLSPPPPPTKDALPAACRERKGAAVEAKRSAPAKKESLQSLRVDATKLDDLVNLVGELVIAQARLTQLASGLGHPALTSVAEEIERLSNELRDNTLGIRMLPIGTTFSRFRRLVRDLSAEMDKSIELVTEGGETELDKTVIEQLNDPLVHLLRNSIDHGIEPPADRLAAGKPEAGSIILAAEHVGGEVLLSITDDGRGMDPERIRAKGVEKGFIPADARLSESEIFNLIFLPGFSTAEKITSVSGRGVGMDVVKRSMDALRGKIEVHSEPGSGTRITIRLPLTLAIIDGLQIKAGDDQYIIPLSLVEECLELPRDRAAAAGRGRSIQLRGEIVPYIRLREAFDLAGMPPPIEQVVVTRFEGERTGIAVDQVMGQQQTVIKSLGGYIGAVPGISGATINGDGTMSLILDVPTLVASVKRMAATSPLHDNNSIRVSAP